MFALEGEITLQTTAEVYQPWSVKIALFSFFTCWTMQDCCIALRGESFSIPVFFRIDYWMDNATCFSCFNSVALLSCFVDFESVDPFSWLIGKAFNVHMA